MPKQCRLFKKKLVEICGESVDFVKQINIYYDDPRFITHRKYFIVLFIHRL